jgi:hypothetical protein
MDGLISMGIAIVVTVVLFATIAFYFGGVWDRFTADTERRIEERGRSDERRREERRGA